MEELKSILTGLRHISKQLDEMKSGDSQTKPIGVDWEIHSKEIDQLSAALVELQGTLPPLGMDASGYNFKYASYPSIKAHLQKYLYACGLSVEQPIVWMDNKPFIITYVRHSSGQWMRDKAPLFLPTRSEIPNNKDYNQELGKAITYMRRYALESIFGIKAGKEEDYDYGK